MISVCIATFNGEKYIKEEIDSILPQLSPDDEIIISDDGSTDSTLSILRNYMDDRIKIYKNFKHEAKFKFDYTTHNFENALRNASGNIIFLADQDDVWLPNKIKIMSEALLHADIAISDCKVVDKNLNIISDSRFKTAKPSCKILKNLIFPSNPGCCIAFKKDILKTILPFPKYGVSHDFWIATYGGIYHKVMFLLEPLILFRRHDNNVSSSMGKSKDTLIYKLKYRWYVLRALLSRANIIHILKNL